MGISGKDPGVVPGGPQHHQLRGHEHHGQRPAFPGGFPGHGPRPRGGLGHGGHRRSPGDQHRHAQQRVGEGDVPGRRQGNRGIPIVLDPVGAGATPYRTATARELVLTLRPAIIRGNASEVMALHEDRGATRGVDSTDSSHDALQAAEHLAAEFGSVVCVSGETDYIVGRDGTVKVKTATLMTASPAWGARQRRCAGLRRGQGDFGKAASGAMAIMASRASWRPGADGQARSAPVPRRALPALEEDIEARLRMEG